MKKTKVAILAGGSSVEREISLRSCKNIRAALDKEKYDIKIYELPKDRTTDWAREIIADPPDIVLSALHGGNGENGSVQGFLHCLGIPFAGSRVLSSALCMDKKMAKTVMSANYIQVPEDIYIKRGDRIIDHADEIRQIGFPLVVKPNRGGSSIGISIVYNTEELESAAENIIEEYDDDVIAEKYIKGREITCAVCEGEKGAEVMAVLDINKSGEMFSYEDKAMQGSPIGDISNMPVFLQDMVRAIAIKTFDVLKCRGYACVDMIVREEQIYVIEVNTLPGLTDISLVPRAAECLHMSFGAFLDRMITFELNRRKA